MNAIYHSADTRRAVSQSQQFLPLEQETRPRVSTEQCAHYLLLRPQTLREQHMRGSYDPRLNPIKIGNRIAWSTTGIRSVLEVQ